MKSIRFAATVAITALSLGGQFVYGQAELKLDDVIKKSIEAQGGLDKLNAVKTMKVSGKVIIGGGQLEAPMVVYTRRPNSVRNEMSIQGQKIVEGFDGTTKWSINPMMGSKDPLKANDEDTKAAADDSDMIGGPLVGYKEKGHTVELLGKEDVEGSMAYKIKVTTKNGNVKTIFIDETSFLTVKTIAKMKQQGQEFETESMPGNYKKVEGVMIPFSTDMKINKQMGMQLQFDKVEFNVPVDDGMFAMPAPEVKKPDPPKAQ